MKKILLFGSTGHLGKAIAKLAKSYPYNVTAVVRNESKGQQIKDLVDGYKVAAVTDSRQLENICDGYDIIISALGKSVSLNDRSRPTFHDIDLVANSNILQEAQKSGVQKFVYVSAFHAEKYLHLNYFQVHHEFAERLKKSGLNFSIVKPPAIFSAFLDLMDMAKKGQLLNMGKGDKKTNPIYEGDLATVCLDAITQDHAIIEAGGPKVYTRKQINEIIQQAVNPNRKLRSMPIGLIKLPLPLLKVFSRNTFDKFAFFLEVMQHDTIAPKMGAMRLEEYVQMKTQA